MTDETKKPHRCTDFPCDVCGEGTPAERIGFIDLPQSVRDDLAKRIAAKKSATPFRNGIKGLGAIDRAKLPRQKKAKR